MKTKNISKFVLDFIQSNLKDKDNDENLQKKWNSTSNLNQLKKILSKNIEKKVKDNNKPKRGKTAYLCFCQDERESVKIDHPDYSNSQIIVELGNRWNNLKDTDLSIIEKYNKMSEKDRDRYKMQMIEYNKNIKNDEDSDSESDNKVEEKINKKQKNENDIDDQLEKDIKNKKDDKKVKKDINTLQKNINVKEDAKQVKKNKKSVDIVKDKNTLQKNINVKEDTKQPNKNKKSVDNVKDKNTDVINNINKKLELQKNEDAFNLFYKKKKNKVEEAYPELNSDEVLKKLKKKWKNLPQDKKDKYVF